MNKVSQIAALAALFAQANSEIMHDPTMKNTWNPDISTKPKEKVIPKGCKEYQFDSEGNITNYYDITVFTCTASNKKNAIKKFKKWEKQVK